MCFADFLTFCDCTLTEILMKCDESGFTDLDSPRWVDGWTTPFLKVFLKSLPSTPGHPTTSAISQLFTQADAQLAAETGPTV